MREIKINSNEANQRVDKFLSKYLDKANKSFIYKMLRKKNITLNNKKSDGSEKLNEGDIIKIFFTEETLEKFSSKPDKNNIISSMQKVSKIDVHNIIYEDDLVVLKTNNYDNKMINLNGYSYKEADNILRLMGVSYILEGNGYVYEQSIPEGETITDTVTIKLKNKYME